MEENLCFKTDPCSILPDGKSIISVAIPYNTIALDTPLPQNLINRYAWGEDYHKIIKKRLQQFIREMTEIVPGFEGRAFVDSAPLPEKQIAAKAGLGWIGKNTLLINPQYGSYLFLGEVVSNQVFTSHPPTVKNRCGSCNRCELRCPGGALDKEPGLDCRQCSSYLSIEKKGPFSKAERSLILDSIFGCDICQRVCPWNQTAILSQENSFSCFDRWKGLDPQQVLSLNGAEFERLKIKSPVKRVGLEGLKRNAKALIENQLETALKIDSN